VKKKVIICGAAGRDYHNFLVYFKDNPLYEVVCFTQTQIPDIEKRSFPKELAGKHYKKDIPFYPEEQLPFLIKKYNVDEVFLCYSDLNHIDVMHKASLILANGATFSLLGPKDTQLTSKRPMIAVTAVRTGAGKSQTSRKVAWLIKQHGYKVVGIRHPMPYGDLKKQEVQRFASHADLKKHKCTIEEQEEYTPWIDMGIPIYAGVDYKKILHQAEQEAELIIWDGGNNDFSFYKPDLHITVLDPHRPGHERLYYPGESNFLSADVIVINKESTAPKENIQHLMETIEQYNPKATVIHADSAIVASHPEDIRNKKVLVVEDGPTLTHGGMAYGAGVIAAQQYGGKIIDAERYAVGSIKQIYKKYTHLKKVLPAMGYSDQQIKELQQTINRAECDLVIDGSPVNLKKVIKTKKPIIDIKYTLQEKGHPTLWDIIKGMLQ
jgi:predicted GTPase